jgi:hypothetical protein
VRELREDGRVGEQFRRPIGNGRLATVSSRRFDGIGLHLMLEIPTPYDKANIGSRSIPEGHRCTGMGFHRLRRRKAARAIIDRDGDTPVTNVSEKFSTFRRAH